jgi:DNA-directed RNA polymerase subunit RPC12/RpoP
MATVPESIKCPKCSREIDTIHVNIYTSLYYDGEHWRWAEPEFETLEYFCPECGEEISYLDDLEIVVLSAY